MSDLRTELQRIYDANGYLDTKLVVQAARADDHPLHSRFEWNDEAAGELYRAEQARKLISSVTIVYQQADTNHDERRVRAFQAVRTERGHVFEPTEKIAEDPFLRRLVLNEMERDYRALQVRYGHFREFSELLAAEARKELGDTA